jgi:hypothetical protein
MVFRKKKIRAKRTTVIKRISRVCPGRIPNDAPGFKTWVTEKTPGITGTLWFSRINHWIPSFKA